MPVVLAEQLLEIAHKLDSGESLDLTQDNRTEEDSPCIDLKQDNKAKDVSAVIDVTQNNKTELEQIKASQAKAIAAVNDWLRVRGGEPGALLCPVHCNTIIIRHLSDQSVLAILRKRQKAAGVEKFSPHDLRRTFISDLLDAGADIVTVQKVAGHANTATTAKYERSR